MNLCLGYECPSPDLNNDQTDSFDTSANIILITVSKHKGSSLAGTAFSMFSAGHGPDDLSIS
jgi:hypothetical protein